jgi:hypothetical protein
MTINEAIKKLEEIKKTSKLKGNTCLIVCLTNSSLPYVNVDNIELEKSEDGAIVRIDATLNTKAIWGS